MTPYYQDSHVTIWHADCRDVLPTLAPVDLVLTDPPYNIGYTGYLGYQDEMPDPEYVDLLAEMERFDRKVVIDYPEQTMRYIVPALGSPGHVGAWCYNANIPRRFRLVNYYGCEPDYSRIRQPYKNPTDKRVRSLESEGSSLYEWWSDIQLVKNVSPDKKHPCPVPRRLMARIITLCSEAGDTILDPFAGSGTTGRAAKDLGRKAILIEIEERYAEIAAKRMSQLAMELA